MTFKIIKLNEMEKRIGLALASASATTTRSVKRLLMGMGLPGAGVGYQQSNTARVVDHVVADSLQSAVAAARTRPELGDQRLDIAANYTAFQGYLTEVGS